jgi:hypothetical protein
MLNIVSSFARYRAVNDTKTRFRSTFYKTTVKSHPMFKPLGEDGFRHTLSDNIHNVHNVHRKIPEQYTQGSFE